MSNDLVRGPQGIYVPLALAESRRSGAPPDLNSIATTGSGRDITRGYILPQMRLMPQDGTLKKKGYADLRLYENLLLDEQVMTSLTKRRLAVTSKEWYVEPGGKRAIDKAAADSLRAQLQEISFDGACEKILYAVLYGYAVAEIMWTRDGREVVIDDIHVRKARRFFWDGDMHLRLATMEAPLGELMPDRKFWIWRYGADNDDEPYGLGEGSVLYWLVWFKRNIRRFQMIYLDKYGMPTAVGSYPQGVGQDQKDALLAMLDAIATDSGVIKPDGMLVELLEAARSGSVDYDTVQGALDDAIARVLTGHSATSKATPGKLGNEQNAEEGFKQIIKADADALCESFNTSVAQWLSHWNYPDAASPKVWRHVEDPLDQQNRSKTFVNLASVGFRPSLKQVQDEFGAEFEDVGMQPARPMTIPGDPAPQFAEGDDADPLAGMVAKLTAAQKPQIEDWIERIRKIVAANPGGSMHDLARSLDAAFPDLPADDFAEIMRNACAVANLQGRAAVLASQNSD